MKEKTIPLINSHPKTCLRLSPEEKKQFQQAAEADGKALGTWLKWLARHRIDQQRQPTGTDANQSPRPPHS